MDELVPVQKQKDGSVVVSGRDLHDFLDVKTKYADWFKRMSEYGFDENVDFAVFLKNEKDDTAFGGSRKITDHALTLDMAKEISMIQRTERGKQARRYFLEVEKRYKQQLPQTPEEKLALTMQVANRLNNRMAKVEDDIDFIKNKSEIDSTQRYKLKAARNRKAVEICGGSNSNFYNTKGAPRKVFRELEHDLKEVFVISRYEDLKKEDFDRAVSFINNWHASYPLEQEISQINAQVNLEI
ncbi:MAG: ORF6C domain-containing protein [Ligilactobacillus animalis]|uniref:antA/AntB antirepressor family protein n=1 Tax=Ligilactobacillus animalis TaxID=1605 RepID=UPI002431379A|nr:ORF6C domain-containing protein [Ligilactobacillus animalis]MCI5942689.1 ORF6C domain-containing protein [Ligilactobacillus animalis]